MSLGLLISVTYCSHSSSDDAQNAPNVSPGANPSGTTFSLDAQDLVVSSSPRLMTDDFEPSNKVEASNVTASEVTADFRYSSRQNESMDVTATKQHFENCSAEPSVSISWIEVDGSNREQYQKTMKDSDDDKKTDLSSGKNYVVRIGISNAQGCSTVYYAFDMTRTVHADSPAPTSSPAPNATPSPGLPSTDLVPKTAAVSFWAIRSNAEGCEQSFLLTFEDLLFRCRDNATCVGRIRDFSNSVEKSIHIVQYSDGYEFNLVWIYSKNDVEQSSVRQLLTSGKTASFTSDRECVGEGKATFFLADSAERLVLFGDKNGAKDWNFADEIELKANGLGVVYAYDQQDYSWQFTFTTDISDYRWQNMPQTVRWNLYNTRARAMIAEWQDIPKDLLKVGTLKVNDPKVLRRLLPRQGDLQVAFEWKDPREIQLTRQIIRYDKLFRGTNNAVFKDLTNIGRSRFELKESDLPPMRSVSR